MSESSFSDPSERQVLINLGNRFVVFGPDAGLPEMIRFDPMLSPILPRVADESEVSETRVAETLQVAGMTRNRADAKDREHADFILTDSAGHQVFVDLKVREGGPKRRDLQVGTERLNAAKAAGHRFEIWFLNAERLKLTVMSLGRSGLQFDDLVPLNVWEKTPEGVFERQRVIAEVEDWLHRVKLLYSNIQAWLGDLKDLRFEKTRTVLMSEELMQKFAVVDREVEILDVLRGDQVVTSFVPRGLWLLGSWGRIDVITKSKTSILVAIKKAEAFDWEVVFTEDRRQRKPFDRSALLELMSDQ
jgi:hypothetical protein